MQEVKPKAIILSGGPNSVHIEGAPTLPAGFFEWVEQHHIPVLGICYGTNAYLQDYLQLACSCHGMLCSSKLTGLSENQILHIGQHGNCACTDRHADW